MTTNEKKLVTLSGRKYPNGWEELYDAPMGFWKSMGFIFKMSLWNITLKPDKRVSIWLVRMIVPFVWFLLYVLGQGSFLPFIIVGFVTLMLLIISLENTKGMEHRLTFMWGITIPLVLLISPFIAFIIMGGGNKEGLGKYTSWNDQTSINPLNQIKTGRSHSKHK
jgi:hypothetical protein